MSQHTPQAVMVLQHQGDDVVASTLFRHHQPSVSASVVFSSEDSQSLLRVLQELLAQQQCSFDALAGVVVVPGDARFTVSRLVAVVANTVAWSMHIPVVVARHAPTDASAALELVQHGTRSTPVAPQYSKDPRIS